MKKRLLHLLVLFLIVTKVAYAQNFIGGKVIDGASGKPLSGANVVEKGSIMGVPTDAEGKFSLEVSSKIGILEVSYLGFVTKQVPYRFLRKNPQIAITLEPDTHLLPETVVNQQLLDVAVERKTPVAVSTVFASDIKAKLGNREFPEILNQTPSVYVTKSGGGYGDARVNIRGFSNENIAVMVNGVPVNDMENGRVYWSNWAGIADVTSLLQVQRGLGASKLAIASIGGTLNIVTRSSNMQQGGVMHSSIGTNLEAKTSVSYNTGQSDRGFSASVLLGHTSGSKYVNGTDFRSYNYYLALGYTPSQKHDFQLMLTGSPQWHNQRISYVSIQEALERGVAGKPDRKFNSDLGYLAGEEYNIYRNVYHKPIFIFNWDWNLSDKTKFNTTAYTSFGRGFGTQMYGSARGRNINSFKENITGLYDFDQIVQANQASTPDEGVLVRGARINSHDWYGVLTSLKHNISQRLSLNIGFDGRYYKGYHYAMVNDFLGASSYKDDSNKGNLVSNYVSVTNRNYPSYNPFFTNTDPISNTIVYNNIGRVSWLGIFGQLEYTNEYISAFFQGALSSKGYNRTDNFLKEGTLIEGTDISLPIKTKTETILGYNVKAGINHNIENHNIFANIGFYEKQPDFNAVYVGETNLSFNNTNEKILGIELGYGFKLPDFTAKLNVYRTTWRDRYLHKNNLKDVDINQTSYYAEISNLNETHQGIELELSYAYSQYAKFVGMFSCGDWYYEGNAEATTFSTTDGKPYILSKAISNRLPLLLDGVKVGGTAQLTAGIGAVLTPVNRLKFNFDWQYVNSLYADFDVYAFSNREIASKGALKLPSYNLFDATVSYHLPLFKKQSVLFSFNVYNLLDTYYVSESQTNIHSTSESVLYKGIDVRNKVYFGFGRTWNFSVKYSF